MLKNFFNLAQLFLFPVDLLINESTNCFSSNVKPVLKCGMAISFDGQKLIIHTQKD